MTISQINEINLWNDLYCQCYRSDIMQTWAYGSAVEACISWHPKRLLIENGGRPIAIAQILERDISCEAKIIRIQHGPLFIKNGFNEDSVLKVLSKLKQYFVDERGYYLHLSPCLYEGDLTSEQIERLGYQQSFEVLWASVKIDLTQDKEQLFKNMRRKWRNPLKKSLELGLKFKIHNLAKDKDWFVKKYRKALEEKGFSWPSAQLVEELWNQPDIKVEIVTASYEDNPVAAMVPISYSDICFGFAAWNSEKSKDLHAHNFLIWNCILEYQSRGLHWFDLGGIDPINLPGITKFKRNIGGIEYRLVGNFEAIPAGFSRKLQDSELIELRGDILFGQRLPRAIKVSEENVSDQVKSILQNFISHNLKLDIAVDESVSLVDGGIIDSLSMVTLIQILQDTFEIKISPNEITIDNFDNIASLSSLIKSKLHQ